VESLDHNMLFLAIISESFVFKYTGRSGLKRKFGRETFHPVIVYSWLGV